MFKQKSTIFFSLLLFFWVGANGHGLQAEENMLSDELRAKIAGQVFAGSCIRDNLSILCNEIGGRVSGTEQGNRAQEFAFQKLSEYGLDDIRLEAFEILGWQRVSCSVSVVSPQKKGLSAVALANTPSTLAGGITAEVIDVGAGHLKEFAELGEKVRGKIVLVRTGTLPGEQWIHRSEKMSLSMEYGAAGLLLRTTVDGDLPQTGVCRYGELSTIPGVGISKEDGEWLLWMLGRGEPVVVTIQMENRIGPATAANVIGEIRGKAKSGEMVIVGAHLDSWDLGTGAVDNGTGSAVVLEAARALAGCGVRPKRTIRCILFMGEELGLVGSKAYVNQHREELDDIVMMMNLDMVGTPYGYYVHGHQEAVPFLMNVAHSLQDLGMDPEKITSRVGIYGDFEPFLIQGVPTMTIQSTLENEMGRYYHTSGDTYDKLDFKSLNECAVVVAVTLMEMAEAKERVGRRLPPEEVEKMLIENNYREILLKQGSWPFHSANH